MTLISTFRAPPRLVVLALLTLSACSSPREVERLEWETALAPTQATSQDQRPELASNPDDSPSTDQPPTISVLNDTTLTELVQLSLAQRPELDAAQREVAARLAEVRQASRRKNPSLQLQVEDFAGFGGELDEWNGAQSTLSVTQLFERGGKRAAREELARLEAELARRDGGLLAQEVVAQTTLAYWRTLQAQGELDLARSIEETTRGFLEAVRERVAVGKVSAVEEAKYTVALASASLDRRDAERTGQLARRALERQLGGEVRLGRLAGSFDEVAPPPSLDELRARLLQSPRFAQLVLDQERADAVVELAEAASAVDLELSIGLRRFETTDDYAAVVGLDIPLPIFDRRKDAQAAARERRLRAGSLRASRELQLELDLERAWSRLVGAHYDLRSLEDGVLRDSAWVSEAVDEGYREGKFELLDALDAQRTDFEVRARHLRARADFHIARTELEALLCQPLDL